MVHQGACHIGLIFRTSFSTWAGPLARSCQYCWALDLSSLTRSSGCSMKARVWQQHHPAKQSNLMVIFSHVRSSINRSVRRAGLRHRCHRTSPCFEVLYVGLAGMYSERPVRVSMDRIHHARGVSRFAFAILPCLPPSRKPR